MITRTDLLNVWTTQICSEKFLRKLICRYSSNSNESAHNVTWTYVPKHVTSSKRACHAGAVLAAIHLNDGQIAVGEFIESLGYSINLLHNVFLTADMESVKRAEAKVGEKREKKKKVKDGNEYYEYGGH